MRRPTVPKNAEQADRLAVDGKTVQIRNQLLQSGAQGSSGKRAPAEGGGDVHRLCQRIQVVALQRTQCTSRGLNKCAIAETAAFGQGGRFPETVTVSMGVGRL